MRKSHIICSLINYFRYIIQGEHGIKEEVYLSLPCVLMANGVSHIVKQILTESETIQLQKSAALMHQVQLGLKW